MKYQKLIFIICTFLILLYIPLTFTIYSSSWYEFNYEKQNTSTYINNQTIKLATNNLISFFLHKEPLNKEIFSDKEIKHYKEVRLIYDILFFINIICIFLIGHFFRKEYIKNSIKFNIILIIIISLMFINFQYFWDNIFHQILFNNNYYINTPQEISYYLFPLDFFKNSIIFIFIVFILENLILFLYNKKLQTTVRTKAIKT